MRKYIVILLIFSLFSITGCSKKFELEGKCFTDLDKKTGYCFDTDNKGYFVIKTSSGYRGTYSLEDSFTWEKKENIVKTHSENTSRNLSTNENTKIDFDYEYKLDEEKKSLTYTDKETDTDTKYIYENLKLSDVKFDKEIDINVNFMGESKKFELSNYFVNTGSLFHLPIKDFDIDSNYKFANYSLEIFYLPVEKFNSINNNDYQYIYRNLLSKYRICYETDNGKNYYNQLDQNTLVNDKITYYNIDYCTNLSIEDNIDVKELYSSLTGTCYAKTAYELMCFNDDMTKVYLENHGNLSTYNLEIKDGLYTFNNNEILILNSKLYGRYFDKLSLNGETYSRWGDTKGFCVSCPEYINPE